MWCVAEERGGGGVEEDVRTEMTRVIARIYRSPEMIVESATAQTVLLNYPGIPDGCSLWQEHKQPFNVLIPKYSVALGIAHTRTIGLLCGGRNEKNPLSLEAYVAIAKAQARSYTDCSGPSPLFSWAVSCTSRGRR